MRIPIIDDDIYEEDEIFYFQLFNPSLGCKLGDIIKAEITIENDDEIKTFIDRMAHLFHFNRV